MEAAEVTLRLREHSGALGELFRRSRHSRGAFVAERVGGGGGHFGEVFFFFFFSGLVFFFVVVSFVLFWHPFFLGNCCCVFLICLCLASYFSLFL